MAEKKKGKMTGKIVLGATYKEMISGFEGVATGFTEYIAGCNQVLLQPPVKSDGTFVEPGWFDAQRCIRQNVPVIKVEVGSNPGCDIPAPKR